MYSCRISIIVPRYGEIHIPTNINGIALLQKRAIRLLFDADRLEHTAPVFRRANVLKFTDIVKFKTAFFMYQAYHCMLPVNLQKNFVKHSNLHATRSKLQLTRTCIPTNVRAMSLTVYGIKLWNSLSPDLKNVMSINVFKTKYIKMLICEYV